jgi:hypothetical protein
VKAKPPFYGLPRARFFSRARGQQSRTEGTESQAKKLGGEGDEHAKKTSASLGGSTYLFVFEDLNHSGMKDVHRASPVVGISLTKDKILLDSQLPPSIHFAYEP